MRVNDLSKEIGRSNREVLSFLEEKGEKKAPMSNVTAEEADMIRNHFKPKNTEAVRVDKSKTQQDTAERAEMQGEQPKKKKKFTAVFRPENAQQIRVKGAAPEGAKAAEKPVQRVPHRSRRRVRIRVRRSRPQSRAAFPRVEVRRKPDLRFRAV